MDKNFKQIDHTPQALINSDKLISDSCDRRNVNPVFVDYDRGSKRTLRDHEGISDSGQESLEDIETAETAETESHRP